MDGVPFDIETPAEHAHRPPPYEINGGDIRFAKPELLFLKGSFSRFLSGNGCEGETERQTKGENDRPG